MDTYNVVFVFITSLLFHSCAGQEKGLNAPARQWETTYYCGKTYNEAYKCEVNCISGTASECPPDEFCFSGVFCPGSKPSITPVADNYCGVDPNQAKDCHEACPYGRGCSIANEFCWAGITECLNKDPTPTPSSSPASSTRFCGKTKRRALRCTKQCKRRRDCEKGERCYLIALNRCKKYYCGSTVSQAKKCLTKCNPSGGTPCPDSQTCRKIDECASPTASVTPISSPTPIASQTSIASSSPRPSSSRTPGGMIIGYYAQTWVRPVSNGPAGATMSIAFSGWMNVESMLVESNGIFDNLKGDKYITFGGGNQNGRFTLAGIQGVDTAIKAGRFNAYKGLVYDLEIGDSGLTPALLSSFSLARSKGFVVIVTVSHSLPYDIADARTVMAGVLSSSNVDYVSPQLYTFGTEARNDYAITQGYEWTNYVNCVPKVVPSIVQAPYYDDAVRFFANVGSGIPLHGFIQWKAV